MDRPVSFVSIEQYTEFNCTYSPYESRVGGIMTIRSQQRRFDKLDKGKEQPSIVRSTLTNSSSGGRMGGNKIK